MSVTTTKYARKPLIVDAVQITEANFDEINTWCQGEIQTEGADYTPGKRPGDKFIRVRVHNPKNPRYTKGFVGDWLLYTELGYKVYTSKAFQASFDEIQSGESQDIILGTEEILKGVTLNDAVAWLREQSGITLDQIGEMIQSGNMCTLSKQNVTRAA